MPMTDNDTDKKPLHGPNLILDVENFGPIAEAKNIEFRPMTVFVGPSNTGKSYLAMLLHAMLQGRREYDFWSFAERRQSKKLIENHRIVTELANWKKLKDSRIGGSNDHGYIEVPLHELPTEVQKDLHRFTAAIVNQQSASIRRSIREYFEVDADKDLVLNQVSSVEAPSVELRVYPEATKSNRGIEFYADTYEYELPRFIMSEQAYESLDWIGVDKGSEVALDFALDDLAMNAIRDFFPNLTSNYLPASRTGIMVSHATITDRIIANASRIPTDGLEVVPFRRIHGEFLRKINAIGGRARSECQPNLPGHSLALNLEGSILDGAIAVERDTFGLPRFIYERGGFRCPLFGASSMVTELAPLVLFLRNYLSAGDLLIFEEPESHLHPRAQQLLAGMLTLMVRSGFRVLITTHSDYFVEQLGIFCNASFLPSNVRARSLRCFGDEIDAGLFLSENEVGVYGFGQGERDAGTVVTEIPFDDEVWEFGSPDHTAAVIDQFNRNSRITAERIALS